MMILIYVYEPGVNSVQDTCDGEHHLLFVQIRIIDTLGREIAIVYNGELDAGEQHVGCDLAGLTTGAYLVQVTVNGVTGSRMVVKGE